MENYYNNPDNIVYVHNYIGLILITRTAGGKWHWDVTPKDIFESVNKANKYNYTHLKWNDSFKVGVILGLELNKVLEKCHKEFGDIK